VGLAFDWAETQAANEAQGGLFDFGDDAHGSSSQEPALAAAEPWGIRERLQHEKTAIGFYLSGHLFDAYAGEVRRFCRRPIAELISSRPASERGDSREPVAVAGIVGEARLVNGRSGRVLIFRLDDGSESIEAVANDDNLGAQRELLKEDELVVVQGKLQPDRFAGGLRLNVQQVWDLATARARFGRYLAVDVNGTLPPVADLVRQWPARRIDSEQGDLTQGLPVRLRLQRPQVAAEIELGDEGRIWPCDEALARWRAAAHERQAVVVYE
jgi:DNA polymerase-3 subunit alpha